MKLKSKINDVSYENTFLCKLCKFHFIFIENGNYKSLTTEIANIKNYKGKKFNQDVRISRDLG